MDDRPDRLYSLAKLKALRGPEREIEGMATRPTTDFAKDQVISRGARFSLPMPLLWMHRSDLPPVGWVTEATPTDTGIPFKARIAKIDEEGELKTLTDTAYLAVREGLVRGVSIGFTPVESEIIKGGGVRHTIWNWHELSLVSIPCHVDARISVVRALDMQARERAVERATKRKPVDPRLAAIADTINRLNRDLFANRLPRLTLRVHDDGHELTRYIPGHFSRVLSIHADLLAPDVLPSDLAKRLAAGLASVATSNDWKRTERELQRIGVSSSYAIRPGSPMHYWLRPW
jgi:HK97 family phage prohead protease